MRVVIRHIPGYSWVQVGFAWQWKFDWDTPLYRGLIRTFRFGPLFVLTLPKSKAKWELVN